VSETAESTSRWPDFEEALRKSQSLAAASQFAAAVMHDINNPLEAATNLAYLLRAQAENPDKVVEYANLLEEQLANVSQIARQTLDFCKAPAAMKAVDLVAIANAALRVHEHKISVKRLRLHEQLPAPAIVLAHGGELLQVLTNLIANAVDAVPENGVISIRIRKCRSQVHVVVADNGHGIPETHVPHIFEPFFTTKHDRGTGLGLAISKSIVERHKGRIRARSCVRRGRSGTAFRITLPLHMHESTGKRSTTRQ
jgi:signal transduction histidine kinase